MVWKYFPTKKRGSLMWECAILWSLYRTTTRRSKRRVGESAAVLECSPEDLWVQVPREAPLTRWGGGCLILAAMKNADLGRRWGLGLWLKKWLISHANINRMLLALRNANSPLCRLACEESSSSFCESKLLVTSQLICLNFISNWSVFTHPGRQRQADKSTTMTVKEHPSSSLTRLS